MDKILDLLVAFAGVFAAMSPWLVAGFFAAGVMAVWIPRAWVNRVMGGRSGFSGILRATLIGVPLPICSCGILPIAAFLVMKGVSPGAAFVFLMLGPAMNAMSVTTVASLIGHKAAAAYVATIIAGEILCACLVNAIVDAPTMAQSACCTAHGLGTVHWISAVFLAAMMAYNLVRPVGMHCAKK